MKNPPARRPDRELSTGVWGGITDERQGSPMNPCTNTADPAGTILVVGIGNLLLTDEGVGIRVIEALKQMNLGEGVEVLDGGTSGADLADALADRPKVIVIDAIQADGAPGSLYRLTADDVLRDRNILSMHELGFLESLLMVRQLGCAPGEVVIIGIQPKDLSCSLELTPEVTDAVPKAVALVLEELGIKSLHRKETLHDPE